MGTEPRYNDLRYNDIPGLTMGISFISGYNEKNNVTDRRKCHYSQYSITKQTFITLTII